MRKTILKCAICTMTLSLLGGTVGTLNAYAATEPTYSVTKNFDLSKSENEYLQQYAITGDAANQASYKYFSNGEAIDFSSGCLIDMPAGSAIYEIPLATSYYGAFNMIMQPVMQNVYKKDSWNSWGYESADYKQIDIRFDDLYSDEYITVRFTGDVGGYTYVKVIYQSNGVEIASSINTTATSLINVNMFGMANYLTPNRNVPIMMQFDPSAPQNILLTHNKNSALHTIAIKNGAELPVFENYSVTLAVAERSLSASSKLMLYEVGGQRLNGESILDTSAPVISTDSIHKFNAPIKAVKGYSYTLPETYAYDMFKGDLSQTIQTTVTAPDNTLCTVTDGKFRVDQKGVYTITYTVTDGVNSAERIMYLDALEEIPVCQTESSFTLEKEYARFSTVYLPKLTMQTGLTIKDEPLDYSVFVQKNYKTIHRFTAEEAVSFIPEELGTYDVVYVAENEMGLRFAYNYSFTCIDTPYFKDVSLDAYMHCGAKYVFPSIPLVYGGVEYPSVVTKIEGAGTSLSGEYTHFTPETYGTYTVTYSTEYNGVSYEKQVEINCSAVPTALFKNNSGITSILANQDLPYYSKAGNGVMILASKNYSVFDYAYLIDLNQLTKTENLIQFQVLHGGNYATFDTIIIDLIDENDPNNVLKIKMQQSSEGRWSYMNINYDGRDMGLWAQNNTGVPKLYSHGSLFHGTFNGSNYTDCGLFGIQFDYANKCIYTDHFRSLGTMGGLVLDMTDETIVGEGKAWEGFSTGRVYMRVSMSTLNSTGGIIVTQVAGTSLSGYECASAEPRVYFEANPKADYANMPVALVNTAYPIPEAQGYDHIFGESKLLVEIYPEGNPAQKVVFDYNAQTQYTFTQVGNYVIHYTATNWNNQQWTYDLVVPVANSLPALGIEFSESVSAVGIGEDFKLPQLYAVGGSGIAQIDYNVYYGDSLLDKNTMVHIDRIENIRFVYSVSDYQGNIKTGEEVIDVIPNEENKPIITLLERLPLSAKVGDTIPLPDFKAIDYNYPVDSNGYYPESWIEINGTRSDNTDSFVVSGTVGDTVTVAFCSGEVRVEKYIRIIQGSYLAEYVLAGKSTTELETGKFEVSATMVEDDTLTIANRVSQNEIGIRFSVDPEKNGMESIKVVFRDGLDATKSVTLTFTPKDDKTAYMQKSGSDKLYVVNCSFESAQIGFSFIFDAKTKQLKTIAGAAITAIDKMDNGADFDGFYNGGVEVSFVVGGVDADKGAQLNIQQVSNQQFASRFYNDKPAVYSDRTTPVVYYFGTVPEGQYHINEKVTLPIATSYDVLNGEREVFVRISAPNGSYIIERASALQTYDLELSAYGKYKIEYIAVDKGGREYITPYIISVLDEIPPVITITEALNETYALGSTVKLPAATATDNISTITVYVTVCSPDTNRTVCVPGDTYTFTEKGKYRIYYRAVDEAGNYVDKLIIVTVN